MRFMVIIKATKESESGTFPPGTAEAFAAMGRFNEELVKAGVMLAGDGLQPSSKGARLHFRAGGPPETVDGPFAETKELVGGFWLVQTRSLAEAIEWFRRAPMQPGASLELRQVYEPTDFGDELFPPEEVAKELGLAAEAKKNAR